DGGLAVLQPALGVVGVVLAGVEAARDGGGGQRGPLGPVEGAAVGQAVDDAAAGRGALLEVVVGVVEDFLGDDDAGVAGGPQPLHLGDGDGAFVEAVAVGRRDVAPAAAVGLGLAAEIDRLGQNLFELLAALAVFFFAVDLGQ